MLLDLFHSGVLTSLLNVHQDEAHSSQVALWESHFVSPESINTSATYPFDDEVSH
jgi:hypothetical protein